MERRLNSINNELERAVFMARYNSYRQRLIQRKTNSRYPSS